MTVRLIEILAGWLDSSEREAVLGDLTERGKTNGKRCAISLDSWCNGNQSPGTIQFPGSSCWVL